MILILDVLVKYMFLSLELGRASLLLSLYMIEPQYFHPIQGLELFLINTGLKVPVCMVV